MANESVQEVAGNYGTWGKFLGEMFRLNLLKYFFCLPCVVEGVHPSSQTVDIRPTLLAYYPALNTNAKRAIIKDVPFQCFRAGDTYISLPIKTGDTGLAIFCQRDMSNWKKTGGKVPLQTDRVCDYNDAFFLPFVGPENNAIADYNPDFIEIVKNGKKITVKDGVLDAPEYHINCKSLYASQTIDATGAISSSTSVTAPIVNGTAIAATASLTIGAVSMGEHKHGGVRSGGDTSGGPIN